MFELDSGALPCVWEARGIKVHETRFEKAVAARAPAALFSGVQMYLHHGYTCVHMRYIYICYIHKCRCIYIYIHVCVTIALI